MNGQEPPPRAQPVLTSSACAIIWATGIARCWRIYSLGILFSCVAVETLHTIVLFFDRCWSFINFVMGDKVASVVNRYRQSSVMLSQKLNMDVLRPHFFCFSSNHRPCRRHLDLKKTKKKRLSTRGCCFPRTLSTRGTVLRARTTHVCYE